MGLNHVERQIERILNEYQGVLVQTHPHVKWKFPDGRSFVVPHSGSDHRGAKNALRSLRRFLGIVAKDPELTKSTKSQDQKVRREVKRVLAQRPLTSSARRSLRSELEALRSVILED